MAKNKRLAFSQVIILSIIVFISVVLAAIPIIPSVRCLAYKTMSSYYKVPPRWSIVRLFDNYAEKFEQHLTQTLEYHTPADLTEFIHTRTSLPNTISKVLDLGCGTGLLGQELSKQFTIQQLVGVDLSAKMLQKAKDKNIYTQLHNTDLLEYLQNSSSNYDLITATDVFIYVGDLTDVMTLVHKRLNPDGYFAFSVESLPIGTFKLMSSGRFQHSFNYLQSLSARLGFKQILVKSVGLRKEFGDMMAGYLVIMQK